MISPNELERLANVLLESYIKDKHKNKMKSDEYPILSPSQMKRRQSAEIPYSNLSMNQKLQARLKNYDYNEREGE